MTRATLKHVISASSSERGYEAQNLLHGTSDKRSKWLGSAGAKCNSVVLKLDREYKFTNFHVGNANSALVEIFVSRSVDPQDVFQVIIPSTSFMDQMESRKESPGDRVRIFGETEMIPSVMNHKWDVVKVVCHQPFNNSMAFGLGFFKVEGNVEEIVSPAKSQSQSTIPPLSMNFLDLDTATQSSQSLSTGSLFERRDEIKKDRDDYEKRRQEERRIQMLSKDGGKGFKKEAKKAAMEAKMAPMRPKKEVKKEDSDDDVEVIDIARKSPGTSGYKPKRKAEESDGSQGSSTTKRRVVIEDEDEDDDAEDWPARNGSDASKTVKFEELLKDVCFSLSGYQNPMRGDLRDKGIEMGAKYCNDWTPECTHLVSAFKNTPKMKIIGKHAKAVSGRWIRRCYAEKKRLPEAHYPVSI